MGGVGRDGLRGQVLTSFRLGQVHGVDAQRRDTVDEQKGLQGGRCRGGCPLVIGGGKRGRGETSIPVPDDERKRDWNYGRAELYILRGRDPSRDSGRGPDVRFL